MVVFPWVIRVSGDFLAGIVHVSVAVFLRALVVAPSSVDRTDPSCPFSASFCAVSGFFFRSVLSLTLLAGFFFRTTATFAFQQFLFL